MTPTHEDWRRAATAALKGRPFEALIHHTVEDLAIQPLYGPGPDRAQPRPRPEAPGWDIRAPAARPGHVLEALAGGATSVLLTAPIDLARALDGVVLEAATVALDAGFDGPAAGDELAALAKGSPQAKLAFHLDPLSAFAARGSSPGPIAAHVAQAAEHAAGWARTYPDASLFLASGRVVHEAGGSAAQELGVMAAAAVAYARALGGAGLAPKRAFAGIVLGLSADAEILTGMARIRAAREIWRRITAASQAEAPAVIEARSSGRMLTAMDPHTNLIRLTVAGFAAAAGGADAVVLGGFTDALGAPDARTRRLSRNIQLILMHESGLGHVIDPAAGAWAIEALTEDLAREGWGVFQAIEAQGGLVAALSSGFIAASVEGVRMAREAAVADGTTTILGVNLHPDPDAGEVEVEEVEDRPEAEARIEGADSVCPPLIATRVSATAELVAAELET